MLGQRRGEIGAELIPNEWTPEDQNLIAWSYDPAVAGTSAAQVAGLLYLQRMNLRRAARVTNILMSIGSAGVTLTAGQCFAGLWRADGRLVALTADQSGNWASGGVKIMPLIGGPFGVGAADYYVGCWSNGVTPPAFFRGTNNGANMNNLGLNAPDLRMCTADAGLTVAAPDPFGVQTGAGTCPWMALS